MTRPGAAGRQSVMLADTGSHRLPVIRDEVAGTRRTLFLVFGLLVAMTGIAAFAIGGLITLRSSEDEPARLPAAPEQLAIMVGQLATSPSPAPAVPDPFEMLLPTPTNPGVIVPPIIGLTQAPDAGSSPESGSSGTPTPSGAPSASSSNGCAPTAGPSTPAAGGGGGSVPVLPLSTRCP